MQRPRSTVARHEPLARRVAIMRKKTSPRGLRVAPYYRLLDQLSRRQLPCEFTAAEDVDHVLALRSAMLIEAEMESAELLRTGGYRIGRALVTAITADGRRALAKSLRSSPFPRHRAPPAERTGRIP